MILKKKININKREYLILKIQVVSLAVSGPVKPIGEISKELIINEVTKLINEYKEKK